jgi:acid phosphatase class B
VCKNYIINILNKKISTGSDINDSVIFAIKTFMQGNKFYEVGRLRFRSSSAGWIKTASVARCVFSPTAVKAAGL